MQRTMLRMVHGRVVSAFQLWSGLVGKRASQERGLLVSKRVVARITRAQETRAFQRWREVVVADRRWEKEKTRVMAGCVTRAVRRMLAGSLAQGFRTWARAISTAERQSRYERLETTCTASVARRHLKICVKLKYNSRVSYPLP